MNRRLRFKDVSRILSAVRRYGPATFKKGFSVTSFEMASRLRYYVGDLRSVIDVGANIGQFAVAVHHYFASAEIFSIEPVPSNVGTLIRNLGGIRKATVLEFAVGDVDGEIDFFSNNYSPASSALRVSDQQNSLFPETSKTSLIKVPVRRLDSVGIQIPVKSPSLLKLDVQGYEKRVLEGGRTFLKSIDFLLLEMSFVEMYRGECLFEEMHEYLRSFGLSLVAPLGFLLSNDSLVIQMDALYSINQDGAPLAGNQQHEVRYKQGSGPK